MARPPGSFLSSLPLLFLSLSSTCLVLPSGIFLKPSSSSSSTVINFSSMPPIAASVTVSSLNLNLLTPPTRSSLLRRPPTAKNCYPTVAACSSRLRVLSSAKSSNLRVRSFQEGDGELSEPSSSGGPSDGLTAADQNEKINEQSNRGRGGPFIAKLGIGLGIAAVITGISVFNSMKQSSTGPSLGFQILGGEVAASSVTATSPPVGFSVNAFGYRIILPEYAPGWVYFWLLMAAGCGLFISEEALNIWVGISLSRMLTLDGTWQSFVESFSRNTPYIASTVLWVYWGVCISDMIPFYLGKLFRRSGASDDVYSRLGVGKDKALSITSSVRKYGNLIGFVERFSLGVRNPTAFLAGALGISPEYFFAGVCCGGLITLPVQLGIGFLLRERPLFALATVATAVGIWSIFPYAIAAFTALFLFVRRRYNSS